MSINIDAILQAIRDQDIFDGHKIGQARDTRRRHPSDLPIPNDYAILVIDKHAKE